MDANNLIECIGLTLLGSAIHAAGIRALSGLGEITLRDALISGVAAEGARKSEAWIFVREDAPATWNDETLDLVIKRENNSWVSAIELKWWKAHDGSNASRRRWELVTDLIRCASVVVNPGVSVDAYVVLVTTKRAWKRTTKTTMGDQAVTDRLKSGRSETWNLIADAASPAIKNAVKAMMKKDKTKVWRPRISVPRTFRTRLEAAFLGSTTAKERVYVRVWHVRVTEGTTALNEAEMRTVAGVAP